MPNRHATVILLGNLLGVFAGFGLGWYGGTPVAAVAWLGELFLRALQMLIIPLILAAVIGGVTSVGDLQRLGRVGGAILLYYLATTAMAVLIGLVAVNLLQPGAGVTLSAAKGAQLPEAVVEGQDTGAQDILNSVVAPNLVKAAAETQLLPLVLFAILFGVAITLIGQRGHTVIDFFSGVHEAVMKVVGWLMYLAPLGIMGLVAGRLGQSGGGDALLRELTAVSWHVITVLTGLGIHATFLFGGLWLLTGRGIGYLVTMLRALLTAFGTASSSATLPLTIEGIRESGVDPRAARLVLPLGSTVNMDGTALYEAAAVVFIAQAYGIELALGQQVLIFITATLAAVGAAGIPEAGLVTMVIVLNAVGLPLEGIGLLLAVDWLLDRFRTATNVWGDSVGAAVIHQGIQRWAPSMNSIREDRLADDST